MTKWDVDAGAGRTNFSVRWNDGLPAANCVANGLAHARMQDGRGMLDIARDPNDGCLAVRNRGARQGFQRLAYKLFTELRAQRDEYREIFFRAPGKGIGNDGTGGDACHWIKSSKPPFCVDHILDD